MNCEVTLPEQTYSKLKWSGPATEAADLSRPLNQFE